MIEEEGETERRERVRKREMWSMTERGERERERGGGRERGKEPEKKGREGMRNRHEWNKDIVVVTNSLLVSMVSNHSMMRRQPPSPGPCPVSGAAGTTPGVRVPWRWELCAEVCLWSLRTHTARGARVCGASNWRWTPPGPRQTEANVTQCLLVNTLILQKAGSVS